MEILFKILWYRVPVYLLLQAATNKLRGAEHRNLKLNTVKKKINPIIGQVGQVLQL